ncbi:MAG: hypothetical protein FJY56_22615 [Betaproteobacteria bacterium]|nr:hypothetical protein [Betaproteobacteria bacterium]
MSSPKKVRLPVSGQIGAPAGHDGQAEANASAGAAAADHRALQIRVMQLNKKIEFLEAEHATEKHRLKSQLESVERAIAYELREPIGALQRLAFQLQQTPQLANEARGVAQEIARRLDAFTRALDAAARLAHVDARLPLRSARAPADGAMQSGGKDAKT